MLFFALFVKIIVQNFNQNTIIISLLILELKINLIFITINLIDIYIII